MNRGSGQTRRIHPSEGMAIFYGSTDGVVYQCVFETESYGVFSRLNGQWKPLARTDASLEGLLAMDVMPAHYSDVVTLFDEAELNARTLAYEDFMKFEIDYEVEDLGLAVPHRIALAHDHTQSEFMLERLATDPCSAVRAVVALNPGVSDDALLQLSRDTADLCDDEGTVQCVVATSPYAWPQLLDELSRADDWRVRYEVARNERTLDQTIEVLSLDPSPDVRSAVATSRWDIYSTFLPPDERGHRDR